MQPHPWITFIFKTGGIDMEYRNLGRTGVKVSPLCLGCMNFGWKTEAEAAYRIVDTANVYGRGRSEEILGKALQLNGKRDHIVLATKVHGRMADDDPNAWNNQRRHIIAQCEASLRRLGTDTIDLYQIHRPSAEIPIDETLRALDDLVRAGKVRYLGTSTYAAWQLLESLWVSKEYGLNRFVCEQPPYHLLDRRIERELVPMAQTYGIGLIPWSPLAGGFLTGKYRRGQSLPQEARFEAEDDWAQAHFTARSFDALEFLEGLASEKGCTVSQLALAWCARQPGITSPIIGPRTLEQLQDNLTAVEVEINDEDRTRIDAAIPPGRAIVSYYEADFGPHTYRW
jgi:aryl-alcohol dehydrogenase-like predicted oxidoreductase